MRRRVITTATRITCIKVLSRGVASFRRVARALRRHHASALKEAHIMRQEMGFVPVSIRHLAEFDDLIFTAKWPIFKVNFFKSVQRSAKSSIEQVAQ